MENINDEQKKGAKRVHANPEHREGEDEKDDDKNMPENSINKTNTGEPLVNGNGEELPGPTA